MSKTRLAQCRLYGFIDTTYVDELDPGEVARELIRGRRGHHSGRAKERSHAERVELAMKIVSAAFQYSVPVIINDDIEAAFESGPMACTSVSWTGPPFPQGERADRLAAMRIVGRSTHSLEEALAAERDGVTTSASACVPRPPSPARGPVGVELVREVRVESKNPVLCDRWESRLIMSARFSTPARPASPVGLGDLENR